MKYLLISCLQIIIALQANSQAAEVDKTIKIGRDDESSLYANHVNCFQITAARDPMSTLVFKSTQGKIENEDSGIVNGHFKFSGLKPGKVTVSVFRKNGTGLEFLNNREFYVIPKPMWDKVAKIQNQPEIDIEGYGRYHDDCKRRTVPLRILRKAKKFDIDGKYQITKMAIVISDPTWRNSCQPIIWQLKSNYFDYQIQRVFRKVVKGCTITLDDIQIKDSKGRAYTLIPIVYTITED